MATLQEFNGTSKLRDAWPKIKANQNAINAQVEAIVTGDANAEVGDAHISASRDKTYEKIKDRFEEAEDDISQLNSTKANQSDLDIEIARIDNIIAPDGDPSLTELADMRVDSDAITNSTAGVSFRNSSTDVFEYPEIAITKQAGYSYNGSLPLTANAGCATASIAVVAGDVYRIKTTTYGGSQYAYAFYLDTTLVEKFLKGTASTYVARDVKIVIPAGVDTLIVSGNSWNIYPFNVYKRKTLFTGMVADISALKTNSYEYEPLDITLQLGKFSSTGAYALTNNSGYNTAVVDVVAGEAYKLHTVTYGGSNYAYSLYDALNNCQGNYNLGVAATATVVDAEFEIPNGVTQLLICYSAGFADTILLKKRKSTFVDDTTTQTKAYHRIYPTVLYGIWYQNGVTYTENSDMRTAEFAVVPGEEYHYIGGTFGGAMYAYCLYKNTTLVSAKYLGTSGTLVPRDLYFKVPSGVNKVRLCFPGNYDTKFRLYKKVSASEFNVFADKMLNEPLSDIKFASLGDSITADDYCGIGTKISYLLNADLVGNFAVGGSTCSDAVNGSAIDLVHTTSSQIGNSDVNVLANQVRRLLRHTTVLDEQITWTHHLDGEFLIDTSFGTGLGNTSDTPEIIYIAISTNDGGVRTGTVVDTSDIVFNQDYSDLDRKSIASALRWAIETLQSAYPSAVIFVATPLWTGSAYDYASYTNTKLKADIIKKVASFCSVRLIDSQSESGFTKMYALSGADNSYIHPDPDWRSNIAKYVANEINNKYTTKGDRIYEVKT